MVDVSATQAPGIDIPGIRPAARRRMTSAELGTWRSLLDTTGELRRVLGAELQETSVSPADYQVLLALTEAAAKRMRSSELARTIDWERSRLSHHLGRMERRRLIRRDNCATDSRGAEVSLTAEGRARLPAGDRPAHEVDQEAFRRCLDAGAIRGAWRHSPLT